MPFSPSNCRMFRERTEERENAHDEINILESLAGGLHIEEVCDGDEGEIGARPDDIGLPSDRVNGNWSNHDNQEGKQPVSRLEKRWLKSTQMVETRTVASAAALARIWRGAISAGYNQGMANHPTLKKKLNMLRR